MDLFSEAPWIDKQMVANAGNVNRICQVIRHESIYTIRSLTAESRSLVLPYSDDTYDCFKIGNGIIVQGWKGDVTVNKLFYGKLYRLTEPVLLNGISIGSLYRTDTGQWQGFAVYPQLGFHQVNLSGGLKVYGLCIGDYETNDKPPATFQLLQSICADLAQQMATVNMSSLGTRIRLPEASVYNRYFFSQLQSTSTRAVVGRMVADGVLTDYL